MPIERSICIQNVSKEEFDVRDKIVMPPSCCPGSSMTTLFPIRAACTAATTLPP